MKQLNIDQLLQMISDDVNREGSQKAVASKLGVSEQYLSDVLRKRTAPGEKILSPYNLRAVTNYTTKEKR